MASRELDELANLAFEANDIPLADSVLERQLAELKTPSDRAHVWVVIQSLRGRAPADSVAWAQRAVRLEQLVTTRWPGAVFGRTALAYNRLREQIVGRWHLESDTATTPVHVADLEAAHQELLALAKLPPSEPLDSNEQHMLADMTRDVMAIGNAYDAQLIEEAPTASAERLRRLIAERDSAMSADTVGVGAPPPALTGQYWLRFDRPGLQTGPAPLPAGRPWVLYVSDGKEENFVLAHQTLVRIKRLQDAVPGSEVVIAAPVTWTRHRGLHGEGENRVRGMKGQQPDTASLATEAASLRQFYFTDLGLRGTIVLDTLEQVRLPAPDNRWISQGSAVQHRFADAGWLTDHQSKVDQTAASALLDSQGRVVLRQVHALPPRVLTAVARRIAALTGAGAGPVSPGR